MIPVEKQVKSKQRVADHGEVFTAEREVKAMCAPVPEKAGGSLCSFKNDTTLMVTEY